MSTETSGSSTPANPASGSGGQVPDDPEALLEDIQRTREQLGETVEALAAKADVKARAAQKAARVRGQLTDQVASKADVARQAAARVRLTAQSAGGSLRPQAGQLGETVWNAAPGPAQDVARRAAASVRQHRGPYALGAAAVLLASWLVIRRGRRS